MFKYLILINMDFFTIVFLRFLRVCSFSFDWEEKIYETLKTAFHRLFKHLLRLVKKYSATRRISVFGNFVNRCLSCLIYYTPAQ